MKAIEGICLLCVTWAYICLFIFCKHRNCFGTRGYMGVQGIEKETTASYESGK